MLLEQDAEIIRVLVPDLLGDFIKLQSRIMKKLLRFRDSNGGQILDKRFSGMLFEYEAEIARTH